MKKERKKEMKENLISPLIFTTPKEDENLISPLIFTTPKEDENLISPLIFETDNTAKKLKLLKNYEQKPLADTVNICDSAVEKENKIKNSLFIKKGKMTAYEVARKFLEIRKTIILNEKFYTYNGCFYENLSKSELSREVVKECRKEIERIGKPKFVDEIVDFIYKEPTVNIEKGKLCNNFISFEDAILDINSGQIIPHNYCFYTFYKINAQINVLQSSCPNFENFLKEVTGGDCELVERLWESIGYILTPDTNAKVCFLFQGMQHSGKSILCNFIAKLFSNHAVFSLEAHDFSKEFSLGELEGKALCISSDMPAKSLDLKSASRIKQITGNDTISSNVKFGNYKNFKPTLKLIMVSNYALLTSVEDSAFFERIVTIPFAHTVEKDRRDPFLISKFMKEKDAIVTKALNAYFRLRQKNYFFSGVYPVNSVVISDESCNEDVNVKIYNFVKNSFRSEPENIVSIQYSYECFLNLNSCFVSKNLFSQLFAKYCQELYGAVKTRKRIDSENAISCVLGINWTNS